MTMRCTIERNNAVGEDAYGQMPAPRWAEIATDVACWAWYGTGRAMRTSYGKHETLTTEATRMIVPADTDIEGGDRIGSITDRQDVQLFGEHYVDSVRRRPGHVEVLLREHE